MDNKIMLCTECLRLATQASGGAWIVPKNCKCLFVGDRVNTPHGAGAVVGFEDFDEHGRNIEPSTTDNGRRVIVQLDDPSAWPAHTVATTPPHYFRNEVIPENRP